MKKYVMSLMAVCLSVQLAYCVSLTVYNDDLALVKDVKEFNLSKGIQKIEIDDVSSRIDPTSVLPKFLSDCDKIKIYEQNYDFDLVNQNKLLEKYIGSIVELDRPGDKKPLEVKLLAVNGGKVMQIGDKILLNPAGEVTLPKLPEGLRLKPTLSWIIDSQVAGKKQMQITYQTGGISWVADYIVVLDKKDKNLDMNAWVTINNLSDTTYKDADLKLIAGDVNKIKYHTDSQPRSNMLMGMKSMDSAESFQEKSFFEYHIYELNRKTTVKNNEKKQIEFTSAQLVPVNKIYKYNGSQIDSFEFNNYSRTTKDLYSDSNKKVSVKLEFKNDKSSKLGIALPKGRVRVYKNDGQTIEFVGEDAIDHTAEDETVSLDLGNAFDIVGERIQTDFKVGNDYSQETFKITIKNSKIEDVEVSIVEPLYRWSNWKIITMSDKYAKNDSKTVLFKVKVPAKSEKTITYTVKYTW